MTGPEDNVPPPQRSPDQLVGLIHTKLDHLRRRRRVRYGTAGTAALSLLVVFAAVAISRAGNAPATIVHTAAQAAHPTTSTAAAGPSTPPIAGLPTTGATGTAGTPASSPVVPPPTVSRHPQPTPTTVHRVAPSVSTTTSTTVDDPPSCVPDEVVVTARTDKPSYAIGESIVVTTTIENISGHVCVQPYGGGAVLQDPSGRDKTLQGVGDEAEFDGPADWDPGAGSADTQSFTFTDRYCTTPCMPDIAGTFEAVVSWYIGYGGAPNPETTVSFQVTSSGTGVRQALG